MRATTALSHAILTHQALSAEALRDYAEHDIGAAIALGRREAHRLRAEALRRALTAGARRLLTWPRRQVAAALRFSH